MRERAWQTLSNEEKHHMPHTYSIHRKGILNDEIKEQRDLGIEAGLLWGEEAEKTIVYTDLGISKGMKVGIDRAKLHDRKIEYRKIGWDST